MKHRRNRLFCWLGASLLGLLSLQAMADTRVLYVTHEPGRWHDYSAQRASFEQLATERRWQLQVASGSKREMLAFLSRDNYAAGIDAIVYNFCLADSRDMTAMSNLIAQTTEAGVPALLVHCAMHSWWDTFKKGKTIPGNTLGLARAEPGLISDWQEQHPDRPLPAWGDFTGVASTGHGPKKAINLTPVAPHRITRALPAGYQTRKTELYNNHYVTGDVHVLVVGEQRGQQAIVMWLAERGKGRIAGITLGHDDNEWKDNTFLALMGNTVDFLAAD